MPNNRQAIVGSEKVENTESALVIPVPEADPVVENLRVRYDPAARAGVPAHITVLYPFIAPEALDEPTLAELVAMFFGVAPFEFILSAISRFPDVLYLDPVPAEPFSRLTAAIATRWPETPPYGGIHDELIPHLTIAHTSDPSIIEEIHNSIEKSVPISCTARQAWLMIGNDGDWSLQHRFPLGGTRA